MSVFTEKANAAKTSWLKIVEANTKKLNHVSPLRRQGIRKGISDDNMRYTYLMNLASEWAWNRYQDGKKIQAISARVNSTHKMSILMDMLQNDDAQWLNDLVLTGNQLASLNDTGDRYNADWLFAHDLRWAIDINNTIVARMQKANLI